MRFNVPKYADQITVGMVADYANAANEFEKVAAICRCSVKDAKKATKVSAEAIIGMFEFIINQGLAEDKRIFTHKFTMFGKRFMLGRIVDIQNISGAEFADLMMLTESNPLKHIDKIAAILFRPVTRSVVYSRRKTIKGWYDIETYDSDKMHTYMHIVREMPITVLAGAQVFFSNLETNLLLRIPQFSDQIRKQAAKELNLKIV